MAKRQRKLRKWSVAEKMEVIRARQQGVTLREIRSLYGVSHDTVYKWSQAYERNGNAGLEQTGLWAGRGERSARVEAAEQIIGGVTGSEPRGGIGKARGALYRHGFLSLARETVRKLLRQKGVGPIRAGIRRRNKPAAVKRFERANPNDLWQTDIMSFMIKGQYRAYLIGFMDDNSRFLVGWGLYRFQTAAHVQEVFRAAIEKHGMPKEVLSDNGRQYYTWRGKSAFTTMLTKLGIRHIRSRPYHPQTLGKMESFWRNLFQECLSQLPLASLEEAVEKIGTYVEYYNFKRAHQGIGNMTPSDRYYKVAGQVQQIIEQNTARVEEERPPLGDYTPPAYLVGNLGGQELRVVAKEAEVSLRAVAESPGKEEAPGGCPDMFRGGNGRPESNVAPSSNEAEVKNGDTAENEASEFRGAVGINPAGVGARAAGTGSVPASGGLTRALLPVDEAGEGGGASSIEGEGAGAKNNDRESVIANQKTSGTSPSIGDTIPPITQGERPFENALSGGAADHPAAGVGADARSGQ